MDESEVNVWLHVHNQTQWEEVLGGQILAQCNKETSDSNFQTMEWMAYVTVNDILIVYCQTNVKRIIFTKLFKNFISFA